MEHVKIPGKSCGEFAEQASSHAGYRAYLRALLQSFANVEIQFIIVGTFDERDNIHSFEDVRDDT